MSIRSFIRAILSPFRPEIRFFRDLLGGHAFRGKRFSEQSLLGDDLRAVISRAALRRTRPKKNVTVYAPGASARFCLSRAGTLDKVSTGMPQDVADLSWLGGAAPWLTRLGIRLLQWPHPLGPAADGETERPLSPTGRRPCRRNCRLVPSLARAERVLFDCIDGRRPGCGSLSRRLLEARGCLSLLLPQPTAALAARPPILEVSPGGLVAGPIPGRRSSRATIGASASGAGGFSRFHHSTAVVWAFSSREARHFRGFGGPAGPASPSEVEEARGRYHRLDDLLAGCSSGPGMALRGAGRRGSGRHPLSSAPRAPARTGGLPVAT